MCSRFGISTPQDVNTNIRIKLIFLLVLWKTSESENFSGLTNKLEVKISKETRKLKYFHELRYFMYLKLSFRRGKELVAWM